MGLLALYMLMVLLTNLLPRPFLTLSCVKILLMTWHHLLTSHLLHHIQQEVFWLVNLIRHIIDPELVLPNCYADHNLP